MNYISAQPDEFRFIWEIEVQHYNFEKQGIDLKNVYAIFGYKNKPSDLLVGLKKRLKSNVILIEDTRDYNYEYSPTIRPHILKKFFKENENLIDDRFFYHDSDIIFVDNILFNQMNENAWYMSDIRSYLDYNYISSKGTDVLLDMSEIFRVNPSIFRKNIEGTGGCQYILFGTDYDFWNEVEINCEKIYKLYKNDEYYAKKWSEYSGKNIIDYHKMQWWCSDLWCVLVQAWKYGFNTKLSSELNFSWASGVNDYYRHKIFHNAGITHEMKDFAFDKNSFKEKLPYYEDFSYINDNSNSKHYALLIKEAGKYYGYI